MLMVPPLVAGSPRKVYLACVWEKADTVALWGPEDPKVRRVWGCVLGSGGERAGFWRCVG